MTWSLACCCAPEHGEAEHVRVARGRSAEGLQRASSRDNDLQRRPRPEGTLSAPAALRLPPAAAAPAPQGSAAEKEQDAETGSAASARSARSLRSLGTASSVNSEFIQERLPGRQREIQQSMKSFVKSFVRGRQLGVISPDGQLRKCTCSLDKKLKKFSIELKGQVRQIPLCDMVEVYQGNEPEDIDTPLDELCSTIMLQSSECITFIFPDVPAREHFAMCLQVLVDGQQ